MKNVQIASHKDRLDALFSKVGSLGGDSEMQSHWSRYLCVLVSGFIEASVRGLLADFAVNKSHRSIAAFVDRHLEGFQNPKMEKILALVGSFCEDWQNKLRASTNGELKDAIDSVVANRHLIAHGRSVNISFVTIKDYYSRTVKVVDLLEQQLSE
jgi:hypothetical protein